jgi:hypothetical protein
MLLTLLFPGVAFDKSEGVVKTQDSLAVVFHCLCDRELEDRSSETLTVNQLSGGWRTLKCCAINGVLCPLRFCFCKGGAFDFAFFSQPSRMHRYRSTALIAVRPSFSTVPCKALNIFIKVCYSLACIPNRIVARPSLQLPPPLPELSNVQTFRYSDIQTSFLPPILRTLFQVPYPTSPLFAPLTKTPGVWGYSSHFGTCQRTDAFDVQPLPLPISSLAATFMDLLASVANKRLTPKLNPLDAILTKNTAGGDYYG